MYKHKTLIRKLYALNTIVENADVATLIKRKIFDSRFSKIMSDLDPKTIKSLLRYTTTVTTFHHIELNGKPYYETENMWCSSNTSERPDYDPDTPCNGYRDCEHKASIHPTKDDKIKYCFKYDYNIHNIVEHDDPKCDLLIANLARHELKNVLLTGIDEINIINPCGRNADHRGSDHCRVLLPAFQKITLQKHFTLHDIVIAFYNLKSHKWDRHYEMFVGSEVEFYGRIAWVELSFDHGS